MLNLDRGRLGFCLLPAASCCLQNRRYIQLITHNIHKDEKISQNWTKSIHFNWKVIWYSFLFQKKLTHSPLLCEFPIYLLYENNIASASKLPQCLFFQKKMCIHNGRIHLPHLQIHKYFMDDSTVDFWTRFFFIFLQKFGTKWRKTLSGKLWMGHP